MDFSPKRIIYLLEQKGYFLKRVTGSHHIYFNKENRKTVVVPVHGNRYPERYFYEYLQASWNFKRRNLET